MLFYSDYKSHLAQLSTQQRQIIFKPFLFINLLLIITLSLFMFQIRSMKINEDKLIQNESVDHQISEQDLAKVNQHTSIDAKIYMFYIKDINLKDTTLAVTFALSMTYLESDFKHNRPKIDLNNGSIENSSTYYHKVKQGVVNEVIFYDALLYPHYILQLYPLDRQIISIQPIAMLNSATPFDVIISGMYDVTDPERSGDYEFEGLGYNNSIESYNIIIGHQNTEISNFIGRGYILMDHQSIYTYIKNLQYVFLSIIIALFSLLINSKTSSPKNGRVSVIGSSVFSLTANIFQINAAIKPTGVVSIIDLITFFAGLIIILCFVITLRTLKLIDTEGYETSKVYDLSMFYCISIYVIIFFILVYAY